MARGAVRQMSRQRPCAGTVSDLLLDGQEAEQLVHVDQVLAEFAVDKTQKIQRLVELHQVGVHQYEFAPLHAARQLGACRNQHDQPEA